MPPPAGFRQRHLIHLPAVQNTPGLLWDRAPHVIRLRDTLQPGGESQPNNQDDDRAVRGRRHRDWDVHPPALQFAINTAPHESTGYSPAYLNHGRELARPHREDRLETGPAAAPEKTHRRLEETFEIVRVNLARAFQKQERAYNLRRRDWRPRLGDMV